MEWKLPQRKPPRQPQPTMNPDFYCPIRGCTHSIDGTHAPFLTEPRSFDTSTRQHTPPHTHLANHTLCATAGIYTCCKSTCSASPKIFFSSLRALHDHCTTIHPPSPLPPTYSQHPTTVHEPCLYTDVINRNASSSCTSGRLCHRCP